MLIVEVGSAHAGEKLVAHFFQRPQGGNQLRLALGWEKTQSLPSTLYTVSQFSMEIMALTNLAHLSTNSLWKFSVHHASWSVYTMLTDSACFSTNSLWKFSVHHANRSVYTMLTDSAHFSTNYLWKFSVHYANRSVAITLTDSASFSTNSLWKFSVCCANRFSTL